MSFLTLMDKPTNQPINILVLNYTNANLISDIENKFINSKIYTITSKNSNDITTINSDIETISLNFKYNFFDYIILDHTLEKLIDPWSTIGKISRYLKISGDLLCSFTNIMHISIIKDILNGTFSYKNSKLLDKNILRLFTIKEVKELLSENNFSEPTIINYYTISQDNELIEKLLSLSNNSSYLDYSTYEYFIRSTKQPDLSKYNSIDMINIKYKLMRIDNKLDIENSVSYILNYKYEDLDEFTYDIQYLIDHYTINKDFVLTTLKSLLH